MKLYPEQHPPQPTAVDLRLAVFSENLYHCGASIAALRSAVALANAGVRVDYFFEKGSNRDTISQFFPMLDISTVAEKEVARPDHYQSALSAAPYNAVILHNYRHRHETVVSLAQTVPTLWMMHDASPVSAFHYAVPDLAGQRILRYPSSKGIPSREVFRSLAEERFAFASPSIWLKRLADGATGGTIPTYLVRNSAPAAFFKPLNRDACRAALGIEQDATVALFFAGRGAIERKNLALVMKAIPTVREKNIRFVFIGGVPRAEAISDERIVFLPAIKQDVEPTRPAMLYSAADVLLVPSLMDNFPNTILEAAHCGVPAVAAGVGGIPEIVRHDETGWLIDPREPKGLGELLAKLAGSERLLRETGMRAREVALNEFSEELSQAQYLQAVSSVIDKLPLARQAKSSPNEEGASSDPTNAPAKSFLATAMEQSKGLTGDSHIAPYKEHWNPGPLQRRVLQFRYRMAPAGYPVTRNERRILAWRNRYAGKRGFLIGNGPSLNQIDLRKLKDEVTIGVNSIYLKYGETGFLPTHYVIEDCFVAEDRAHEINALNGLIKWFGNYLRYCLKGDDVNWINVRMRYDNYKSFPYFSPDIARQAWTGGSVTYICMQLAFFLGIRDLYLVGFDHNYILPDTTIVEGLKFTSTGDDPNHFDPNYFGKGYRWHDPNTERMELGYRRANREFANHGRRILNATAGGRLEIFPRVNFVDLL